MKLLTKLLSCLICFAMLTCFLGACQEEDTNGDETTKRTEAPGSFEDDSSDLELPEPEDVGTEGLAYTLLPDGTYEVSDGEARSIEEIVIPAEYQGIAVTRIAPNSFCGMNLTKITIPDSITSIGYGAFHGDTPLFQNPDNWENGVLYIGKYLVAVDSEATLGEYTVKDGTRVIEDRSFSRCSTLTKLTVPDSVVNLGDDTFSECENLVSVYLGSGIHKISENVFFACRKLKTITIPNTVTSIEAGAFNNCTALKSVSIPDSVTSIGQAAFNQCFALETIVLPSSVKVIASYAFDSHLDWLGFMGTEEEWGKIDFGQSAIHDSTIVSCNYSPNYS